MNESLAFGVRKHRQWTVVHSEVEVPPKHDPSLVRKKYAIPDDIFVVGTVARAEYVKGVRYFVEGIIELEKTSLQVPVVYLIVGGGAELTMLKDLCLIHGINRKVIFTDMQEDVFQFMSCMNIYVQPSLNEGMGKTIVQAQSLGLPVIATKVQGIPDVVIDGKTGILVPPKDAKSIAFALLKLLRDKELARAMGNAGRERVKELVDGFPRYSSESMIFLLERIYHEAG